MVPAWSGTDSVSTHVHIEMPFEWGFHSYDSRWSWQQSRLCNCYQEPESTSPCCSCVTFVLRVYAHTLFLLTVFLAEKVTFIFPHISSIQPGLPYLLEDKDVNHNPLNNHTVSRLGMQVWAAEVGLEGFSSLLLSSDYQSACLFIHFYRYVII